MKKDGEKKLRTTGMVKRRKLACDCGSFLLQMLPPSLVVASRWDLYTQTPAGSWGIGVGGVAVLILAFIAIRGKLKLPNKIITTVIIATLSFLLSQVLTDLFLISTTLAAGMIADEVTCSRMSKKYVKELEQMEQADMTAAAVKGGVSELIKKFVEETK